MQLPFNSVVAWDIKIMRHCESLLVKMSQDNNLNDPSEFYESLQCLKLNKKKKR